MESFNQDITRHKTGLRNLAAEPGNISKACRVMGVGRIYQQTFVDTHSKWATARLYATRTPITAAELLSDRVLTFFASQEMRVEARVSNKNQQYKNY